MRLTVRSPSLNVSFIAYSFLRSRQRMRRAAGRVPAWRRAWRVRLEAFADHLFALGPEGSRVFAIECVWTHTASEFGAAVDDVGNVAVFAIAPADVFRRRDDACPHAGRGALRDGLPLEGRQAGPFVVLDNALAQRVQRSWGHVTRELSLDAARVHGGRAHAARFVAAIELDGEEDIGGLGATVCAKVGVFGALEIGVFEIDVRIAMAGRREVHKPRAVRE